MKGEEDVGKSEIEHLFDMMNEIVEQVKDGLPALAKAVKKLNDCFGSFVDEWDVSGVEALKAKLGHAKKYDYTVIVDWGNIHEPVRVAEMEENGVHLIAPKGDDENRGQGCFVRYDVIQAIYPREVEPDPPEPERWEVIRTDDDDYHMESTMGHYIGLGDNIPLETSKAMAAGLQMRDALRIAKSGLAAFAIDGNRQCLLSEEKWADVLDALEKAGG